MTQDEIIRSPIGREQLVALAREAGIIPLNVECDPTYVQVIERFAALVAAPLQAKIDALMLEYCPDEITPEQMDAWMKHQQPVQECRHCGWLCMPNHNPTKKAYVLQQADIRAAVLAEREACAKVCEQDEFQIYETAERCAAAIRSRCSQGSRSENDLRIK